MAINSITPGPIFGSRRNIELRGAAPAMTTTLPALIDDEKQMVDIICQDLEVIADKMTAKASRAWLLNTLCDFLRQGLIETLMVIEAADAGDEIADAALRLVFAEMNDAGIEPPA